MTWGDASPIVPPTAASGAIVLTVDAEKADQYRAFKEEHNKTCPFPEWLAGFTPTSKYHFRARETGLGTSFKLHCDCGAEFYADAGDESL